jgi:hypothetical protein
VHISALELFVKLLKVALNLELVSRLREKQEGWRKRGSSELTGIEYISDDDEEIQKKMLRRIYLSCSVM